MAHLQFAYAGDLFVRYQLADTSNADAIVIFGGWPSDYSNKDTIEFFQAQGYHVFSPLYPGLYQSHGKFLENNPAHNYKEFMQALQDGALHNLFLDAPDTFSVDNIHFFGSSFGGSIALCAAAHHKPKTLTLFAPVWDWSVQEDLAEEEAFAKRAFTHVYRFGYDCSLKEQLCSFHELSPEWYTDRISCDMLVLHDPADEVVSFSETQHAQELIDFELLTHEFGHSMSKPTMQCWDEIAMFLNN